MARDTRRLGNNPPPLISRIRLVVKARPQLPKRFIWEIIQDDGIGTVKVHQTSREAYDTMATAYDKGLPILAEIRARVERGL